MSATESIEPYDTGMVSVDKITGSVEVRTWFEADPADHKTLRGMSCTTRRDGDGTITDVQFEQTGVVLHV